MDEARNTEVSSTSEPSPLFELPQELQDIVFKFAYPTTQNLKILVKSYFKSPPDPFPAPKVDEWLVCRRFFTAASRAWMLAQDFGAGHGSEANDPPCHDFVTHGSSTSSPLPFGLFSAYGTTGTVTLLGRHGLPNPAALYFWRLHVCRKPMDLTLLIDFGYILSANLTKSPISDEYDDAEIQSLVASMGMNRIRGLRRLRLVPSREMATGILRLPDSRRVFLANMARLRRIAWAKMS